MSARAAHRVTFLEGLRARYRRAEGLLELSGPVEGGGDATVDLPLPGMRAIMDAIEAAGTAGAIRAEDLPGVAGVLDVAEVRIGLVPRAGLAMRLTLSDGRAAVALLRSRQGEAVLRQASERMTEALALAIDGGPG